MTAASQAVLDEIDSWVGVMRHFELGTTPPAPENTAELVAAALAAYSQEFVSRPAAVGEPIDRVAALGWSPSKAKFDEWDRHGVGDIGKQGYRGDAIALLAGFGVGITRGATGAALIAAAVEGYRGHVEREGTEIDHRTLPLTESWAYAVVDYLSDPKAARAAATREQPLGWNE